MQRPDRSTAGPPELPELMDALVSPPPPPGGVGARRKGTPARPARRASPPPPHLDAQQLAAAVHVVGHLDARHDPGHDREARPADGEADDGDRVLQARERPKLERRHPVPKGGVLDGQQGDVALGADGQDGGQEFGVVAAALHFDLGERDGGGAAWGPCAALPASQPTLHPSPGSRSRPNARW